MGACAGHQEHCTACPLPSPPLQRWGRCLPGCFLKEVKGLHFRLLSWVTKLEWIGSGACRLVTIEQQTAWVQEPPSPQTPRCRKPRKGRRDLGARRATDEESRGWGVGRAEEEGRVLESKDRKCPGKRESSQYLPN